MSKKEIQNKIEAIHQCEEDGKFELSFVGDKLFVICSICNEKVVSLLLEYTNE